MLSARGYNVITGASGREALALLEQAKPDLVLLDVVMPEMSGYEVCREIRKNPAIGMLPVIMVTALDPSEERIKGLDAGADDFLTKPINQAELLARVRSLLRIKEFHDMVEKQAEELSDLNKNLERKVKEQVTQLERLGRLKRFFSPQLAELIVAGGTEDPLKTHRQEVTVVFLDLRGFTAFAETAEPEEVMRVLREYHAEMGNLVLEHEGTLECFTGDGMMVLFNDPVPIPNPVERALHMTLAMRERVDRLAVKWRKLGYDLGFGVGVAQGYATIGAIGFEGRWDYGSVGTVCNLASRLCGEAKPSQILISQRLLGAAEDFVEVEPVGELTLKGFHRPVTAYNVIGLKRG
jgi:class 3 adenylate cyclase/CheY-like chemotaxis protein